MHCMSWCCLILFRYRWSYFSWVSDDRAFPHRWSKCWNFSFIWISRRCCTESIEGFGMCFFLILRWKYLCMRDAFLLLNIHFHGCLLINCCLFSNHIIFIKQTNFWFLVSYAFRHLLQSCCITWCFEICFSCFSQCWLWCSCIWFKILVGREYWESYRLDI